MWAGLEDIRGPDTAVPFPSHYQTAGDTEPGWQHLPAGPVAGAEHSHAGAAGGGGSAVMVAGSAASLSLGPGQAQYEIGKEEPEEDGGRRDDDGGDPVAILSETKGGGRALWKVMVEGQQVRGHNSCPRCWQPMLCHCAGFVVYEQIPDPTALINTPRIPMKRISDFTIFTFLWIPWEKAVFQIYKVCQPSF